MFFKPHKGNSQRQVDLQLKFILKREIGHDYYGLQSPPDKEGQPGGTRTLKDEI